MNIYLTKTNEENLRKYDGSMSGLINRLLDDFFDNPTAATGVRREVDKIDEKLKELYDNKPIKTIEANEGVVPKPVKLCKHDFPPTTCKHAKPGKPCK